MTSPKEEKNNKQNVAFPAVVVENGEATYEGIAVGEVDHSTDEFDGYLLGHALPNGHRDEPIEVEIEGCGNSSEKSNYGWSRGYGDRYDSIDWGRVTKN